MRSVEVRGTLVAAAMVMVCGAAGAKSLSMDNEVRTVVGGNTAFACDLYHALEDREGNLLLSPHSISAALAMTYGGARGETEAQMAGVMHYDLSQGRLHPAFAALRDRLRTAGEGQLGLANALWGQEGYHFLDEYLALTTDHYDAGFRTVDFERATEEARRTINAWMADHTGGRIEEILQPGDLGPATALALTNAVHFKGSWAARFDSRHTQEGTFRTAAGGEVGVPFMHQTRQFPCSIGEDLDVLEMPYERDLQSMVLLVPKGEGGLDALEASLSPENLEGWLSRLTEQPVQVKIPRFQAGSRFDLAQTLQAIGMTDAFQGGRADFSGMTGSKELFISTVIHQAEVEVDEEGTEAAAGTVVAMKRGPRPPQIAADRPFLFLIRDRETGSILFLGRVVDPSSGPTGQ